MNLPTNGRIIVVDDTPDEAIPLLNCLSKNGHPAYYFKGDSPDDLPNDLDGIRLVFLDMELGTGGADDKSKASKTAMILKKIISENNGPVIVVAWTTYPNIYKKFCEYSDKLIFPVLALKIDKNSCQDADGYNIDLIWKNIQAQLSHVESLNVFITWENILHKSSQNIVSRFSNFDEIREDWNSGLASIFLRLARGNLAKRLDKNNPDDVIKSALHSLNGTFFDETEKEIIKTNYSSLFKISFDGIDEQQQMPLIDGKINSQLTITDAIVDGETFPGNVYDDIEIPKVPIKDLYKGDLDASSKKSIWDEYSKNIFLETTPQCDFVQKKSAVSRMIPGLIWPMELLEKLGQRDYIYTSPIIEYNGHLCRLVFDLRLFTSVPYDTLKDKKPLFMLQHEVLNDIQSRLAAHVSRLGVLSVEPFEDD